MANSGRPPGAVTATPDVPLTTSQAPGPQPFLSHMFQAGFPMYNPTS